MKKALLNIEYLGIACSQGEVAIGGSQEWYEDKWQKASGCGPVAASNIAWYMARSRAELSPLCDVGEGGKANFVKLMCDMFTFITPGAGGVNKSCIFAEGITRYANARGIMLLTHTLEIPALCRKRPAEAEMLAFITNALGANAPVAFLNLSNGSLENLEGWHWVTILSLANGMTARISDQGKAFDIDLAAWLKTTKLGGAMVYVSAKK